VLFLVKEIFLVPVIVPLMQRVTKRYKRYKCDNCDNRYKPD